MEKIPPEAFSEIIEELRKHPIPVNSYRKNAGEGRSQAFGLVGRRGLPVDYSRHCWKRPRLYKLLLDFAKQYVPISYTSITVNQNYQAAPHYDKNNVGNSFLVAFGTYSGGELEIHEGERSGIYNICHSPIIEDFSKLLHSVKPFQGERYSLVFYTYATPLTLPPPSVRTLNNALVFYRGEEPITSGLPHPLKNRKKT